MSASNKNKKPKRKRDWRIWLGIIVTVIWLSGGTIYVTGIVSNGDGSALSAEAS